MKLIRRTSRFRKDVKLMQRRGQQFDEFRDVITPQRVQSRMYVPGLRGITGRR